MPKWYEKYNRFLQHCKRISRANSIHLWFEEMNARMRLNMMELESKKIRTRLSGKQCI